MIHIDRNSNIPIYHQIYNQIKKDILSGNLSENIRITSIRALASELKVGQNSVKNAYDQLVLEGYITGIPGSCYIVNKIDFDFNQEISIPKKQITKNISTEHLINSETKVQFDFQYGEIETRNFPDRLWQKYLINILDEQKIPSDSNIKHAEGNLQLRQQLKYYLYHSRGVKCEVEQIIICNGTQNALEIVMKIFEHNKIVAMEDPCYDGASTVFKNNNFKILTVPVNNNGIDIESLSTLSTPMVYVSPSHQFPTGAIMPIQNRIKLLNLAYKNNMIIIEDDYDSEYRYKGQPIPSLQSIDQNDRVVYVGTFSNILSSKLRISYLVLPSWLLSNYYKNYNGYNSTVSIIEQQIIAKFMEDGYFKKHIHKLYLSQRKKHDILLTTIKKLMNNKVKIYGHHAGSHILLEFVDGQNEDILIQKAIEYGVKVYPVSPFWINNSAKNNYIMLGYGSIKEHDIVPALIRLHTAWFK